MLFCKSSISVIFKSVLKSFPFIYRMLGGNPSQSIEFDVLNFFTLFVDSDGIMPTGSLKMTLRNILQC